MCKYSTFLYDIVIGLKSFFEKVFAKIIKLPILLSTVSCIKYNQYDMIVNV